MAELKDHERAHSGKPGAKVRHGADATGKVTHSPLIVDSRGSLGSALLRRRPRGAYPGVKFADNDGEGEV